MHTFKTFLDKYCIWKICSSFSFFHITYLQVSELHAANCANVLHYSIVWPWCGRNSHIDAKKSLTYHSPAATPSVESENRVSFEKHVGFWQKVYRSNEFRHSILSTLAVRSCRLHQLHFLSTLEKYIIRIYVTVVVRSMWSVSNVDGKNMVSVFERKNYLLTHSQLV